MKTIRAVLLLLGSSAALAANGQAFVRDKGYVSVTAHPVYPFLGGYGGKVFYNLPQHWSVGLQAEGGFELPAFAERSFFTNSDAITVQWDYAVGTEVRYRFASRDNDIRGFYALATAGYEGWTVRPTQEQQPATPTDDSFTNWFASVGVGYNWFPFRKSGFFAGAAYNWIFLLNNTQDRTVGGQVYRLRSSVPPSLVPILHVGWRFGKSL